MDKATFQKVLEGIQKVDAKDGLDVNELLVVSSELRELLTWMVRKKRFMPEELTEHLALRAAESRELLAALLRNGIIEISEPEDPVEYRTRVTGTFKHKFRVQSDIWKLLDD